GGESEDGGVDAAGEAMGGASARGVRKSEEVVAGGGDGGVGHAGAEAKGDAGEGAIGEAPGDRGSGRARRGLGAAGGGERKRGSAGREGGGEEGGDLGEGRGREANLGGDADGGGGIDKDWLAGGSKDSG